MVISERPSEAQRASAYFEYIAVPPDQSVLWRIDDYPWRRCVWNFHPEFELHLIRYSSGMCYVGDHIGHFDAGQIVLVGSNLPHNWVTPLLEDATLPRRDIVVQFDPERFLARSQDFPETGILKSLFQDAALGLEFFGSAATKVAALLETMGTLSALARLGRFLELLEILAQSGHRRSLATPEFAAQFRPGAHGEIQIVEGALDFVQRNFLNSPRLADLAQKYRMSESTFSRFFKAHTGNTFTGHVNRLKIWKARTLLSDSTLPITSICSEAGFTNISNFNRTFLSSTGMTPSSYRKASKTRNI